MINFAIHLHNYWAAHMELLIAHMAALAGLLAVWAAVSPKPAKVSKFQVAAESADFLLGEPVAVA